MQTCVILKMTFDDCDLGIINVTELHISILSAVAQLEIYKTRPEAEEQRLIQFEYKLCPVYDIPSV